MIISPWIYWQMEEEWMKISLSEKFFSEKYFCSAPLSVIYTTIVWLALALEWFTQWLFRLTLFKLKIRCICPETRHNSIARQLNIVKRNFVDDWAKLVCSPGWDRSRILYFFLKGEGERCRIILDWWWEKVSMYLTCLLWLQIWKEEQNHIISGQFVGVSMHDLVKDGGGGTHVGGTP